VALPGEVAVPAAKTGSLFEDLIEVLYKPAEVFERTRKSGFGKYLLVTTLVVAVVMFLTKGLLQPFLDAQFDLQMKLAAAKGQVMPEQATGGTARTFATYSTLAVFALVALVGPLINGLLLLLGGKVAGAALSYRQATLISVLAGVPRLLGLLLMPVLALVVDSENPRSLADLSLSAARFFDPETTSPAVLALLGNLDLFRFWQIALMTVGVAVVARVTRGSGLLATIIAIAIGLILQLIPAALFG
jgi:hypothetical protein